MKKVKVGIVGCGGIANQKHLPSIKRHGGIEIVGFCDLIEERAEKAKAEYGTPDSKVYTDYKELLKDSSIEAVYVLTPNRSHSFITIDALHAGKHVMCEKPMAKTAAEAEKMVQAAKETGKLLTIGYQNRYRPDSTFVKRACENGDLGDIYYAKAHAIRRRAVPTWGVFLNEYEQGGGPLIDIGTHALDLTLWMMDNYEPESVMGQTFKKLGDQTETGNAWGDWDKDQFTVEDSAFGFIRMKNGAVINLEASWALNTLDVDEAKTTLCGTKAGAELTGVGGSDNEKLYLNTVMANKQVKIDVNTAAGGVDFFPGKKMDAKDVECAVWLDAVEGKRELVVKPEQAFVVTQILEAIYESAKTGKPVYLD